MAGVIHICGVIFYGIFASGELESWAEPPKEEQLQLEQTQLPPGIEPPGGYYQDGPPAGGTQPGWNDTTTAYPTWDDPSTAGTGGTNPFGNVSATGYDPNTAWEQSNAATNYGTMDSNQATFYETRAQYIQPGSGY